MLILSMNMGSCFQMPLRSLGQVKVLNGEAREVTSQQVSEGKIKATFDPAVKVAQKLTASASGSLSGSSITFQAGALSISADMVVEEAASLTTTSVIKDIGLQSEPEIQKVGTGLIIRPTEAVSLASPLTINMPIPVSSTLHLQSGTSLAVFYKQYIGDTLVSGVIPSDKITSNADGTCSFQGYFGVYWVALTSKPVLEEKAVKTAEPIVNVQNISVIQSTGIVTETAIVAQAQIPELTWGSVDISFDPASRSLSLSAIPSAKQSLASCKADFFVSPSANTGLEVDAGKEPKASLIVRKSEAHTMVGRFRCSDNLGRLTLSSWSKSVSIPEAIPAAIISLAASGAASDRVIIDGEQSSNGPLYELSTTGYVSQNFTPALADSTGSLTCDAKQTYSLSASPLISSISADGTYSVCVKLIDGAGGVSYAKAPSVTRDTSPPKLIAFSGANAASDGFISPGEETSAAAAWSLSASDYTIANFSAALNDAGGTTLCDSTRAYAATAIPSISSLGNDGTYTLCVRLMDVHGNVSYGKAQALVKATQGITFGSLSYLNEASDSYINDAEKSATNPLWSLSASGASFLAYTSALLDNSGTLLCDATQSYSQGTIVPTASHLTADGIWTVCLRLSDSQGNLAYGKGLPIIRDITYPSFTALSAAGAASDGTINDGEKLMTSPMWSLAATGFDTVAYTSALPDSGGALTCDASKTYSQTSIPRPADLSADGAFAVCVSLRDNAGNRTFGKSSQVLRDVQAPSFASLTAAFEAADHFVNQAEQASSQPLFQLAASGYALVQYTSALSDGGGYLVCDAARTYDQSTIPPIASLGADGAYAVCVRLTDAAGNTTYGKSESVMRDTSPPSFTSLIPAAEASDAFISDSEKLSSSPAWLLNASGDASAAFSSPLSDSAGTLVCDASKTYVGSAVPTIGSIASDGIWVICVRLTDPAGNIVYGKSLAIERDIIAPTLSSFVAVNDASDGFINANEANSDQPLYSVSAYGASSQSFTIPLDDTSPITCDGSKTYSQSSTPLVSALTSDLPYVVCLRLEDPAGNTVYAKSPVVIVDTQAPLFTSLVPAYEASDSFINNAEKMAANPLWSLSATSYSSLAFTIPLDDTGAAQVCDASKSYGAGPSIARPLDLPSDGPWIVCVRLADDAGNLSYGKSQPIVRDTLAPVFSALTLGSYLSDGYLNQSEYAGSPTDLGGSLSGSGYISDQYTLETSATACTAALSYGAMPQSNSGLIGADGNYKICVKLIDPAANVTYGASSSFTVDRTPPAFTGLREIVPNPSGTDAMLFWNAATDNFTHSENIQYQICFSATAGSCASSWTTNSSAGGGVWNKLVTALSSGSTYEFMVRAIDEAGNRESNASVMRNGRVGNATEVAAGEHFTCLRLSDGTVKCWGNNVYGQLGTGDTENSLVPRTVPGLSNVISLSAGKSHVCALLSGGSVKCWGANSYGQLGDGTTSSRTSPTLVSGLSGATHIAAGASHSCARLSSSSVQCWGNNTNGQLGDGTTAQRLTPTNVTSLSAASNVAAGVNHTCSVLSSYLVKCWGGNGNGQLGNGTTADSPTPVQVSSLSNASSLALGDRFSCALLSSSQVSCWGYGGSGQLGNGTQSQATTPVSVWTSTSISSPLTTVMSIALGASHACARLSDRSVKCWGSNADGLSADGGGPQSSSPAPVPNVTDASALAVSGTHSCVVLNSTGYANCWGMNDNGELGIGFQALNSQLVNPHGQSGISSLALGGQHVCERLSDGTAQCWGYNNWGQLGRDMQGAGMSNPISVFTAASTSTPLPNIAALSSRFAHTCALLTNGTVKCWGYNGSGQLGNGNTTAQLSPVSVTSLSGVSMISSGSYHNCALISDTTVKCWGSNSNGQLGNGTTTQSLTPVSTTGATGVTALALGAYHSCALLSNGNVQCWGMNTYGQLGDGTLVDKNTPVTVSGVSGAVALSAGTNHSCAILSSGATKCWGQNTSYQLGDGTTTNRSSPVDVTGLGTASSLGLGSNFSCAVLSDGSARCWGANNNYQLGTGTTSAAITPTPIKGLTTIDSIKSGDFFACAVLMDSSIRCWGSSDRGQGGPVKPYVLAPSFFVTE